MYTYLHLFIHFLCLQAPYCTCGSVLVFGDGNFSFTRGLIDCLGDGKDVVATSYDSCDALLTKFGPEVLLTLYPELPSRLHNDGV